MNTSAIVRTLLSILALAAALQCAKEPEQQSQPRPISTKITANGVKHHYLDWGGTGQPILLLAGFTDTAHAFNSFAPKFTDSFHVYALTRRGFGESDKPAGGYDVATRVEDIREFLDRMKIDRAHLVGHSLAGDELTLFATKYPQRVLKLVYLDAAYNRHGLWAASVSDPAMMPLQKQLVLETAGSPEASTIVVGNPLPPEERRVRVAYMKVTDAFQADYRGVSAPALAFYAEVWPNHPASARENNLERRKEWNAWWVENIIPLSHASREQFRRQMRNGEIVDLPDASHYVFRGRTEDQVVRKTREFLSQ
ncbi:MAG TPA: alpha/beta hydrolase [Thermoanaerobaculia bacterium]|nr:alpha/beta hydrolase [Thermoanaerobaculia bacterium]